MKKISRITSLAVFGMALATPLLATAAGINLAVITPYSTGLRNLINDILVPVLMAIALIVFLWGIFKYFIWHGENESEKAEGRLFAMWGIIGFVIIVALWGIVNLLMSTLSLTAGGTAPTPPTFNPGSTGTSPGTSPGTVPGPTIGGGVACIGTSGTQGSCDAGQICVLGTDRNKTCQIQATNCENVLVGTRCNDASGAAGTCGDMGNGTMGCIVGAPGGV